MRLATVAMNASAFQRTGAPARGRTIGHKLSVASAGAVIPARPARSPGREQHLGRLRWGQHPGRRCGAAGQRKRLKMSTHRRTLSFEPVPCWLSGSRVRGSGPTPLPPAPLVGRIELKRPSLSLATRREIWSMLCACCGSSGPDIDHIVPVSKGGTNDRSNLQPLCRRCNNTKGNRLSMEELKERRSEEHTSE